MAKQQTREQKMQTVGYDAAKHMHDTAKAADQSYKETLLELAKEYHEDGDIKAIVEGVAQYYKEQGYSDASARVKKSEFKSVLDSCALPGSRDHNLSVLAEFKGDYHAFVKKARELRDANKQGSTGGGSNTGPRALTEIGAKKVHEQIGRAKPEQLVSIVDDSVKNMVVAMRGAKKPEEATLIGRQLIATIQHTAAALLKTESAEQMFKDAAEQISVICETVLNKTDQALKDAQEALKKSAQDKGVDEEARTGTHG